MSEAVEIIKFGNRTSITNWKEVRMFFLRRRRVFIGECDGQAVYYDQQTREALAAPKSFLLNTEGARKTNAYIPELVILLMAVDLRSSDSFQPCPLVSIIGPV